MSFSLLQPLGQIPLAVVDTETTGALAAFGHRVIELGIVRLEGGRITAEYQQLIDPERRISPGVTALTGISQSMVTGRPRFADQLDSALQLLRGALIVGHNIRFDLSFLAREFRRDGADICQTLGDVPVLDTVRIARRRFGRGGNGLQTLAPRLGVQPSVAHRALADAQTTAAVFEKLIAPVGGWNLCLCDAIREQGGPMGLLPINPRESPATGVGRSAGTETPGDHGISRRQRAAHATPDRASARSPIGRRAHPHRILSSSKRAPYVQTRTNRQAYQNRRARSPGREGREDSTPSRWNRNGRKGSETRSTNRSGISEPQLSY